MDNFAYYVNRYWLEILLEFPNQNKQPSIPSNEKSDLNGISDVSKLSILRSKNLNNPFLAYYNINSLRYKFEDLKEIFSKSPPDILVLAETKIDHTFPNAQFYLEE